MRLNPNPRRRHLTLEHDKQRPVAGRVSFALLGPQAPLAGARIQAVDPLPREVVGIAEAVARAAAYGPGVLPPGVTDAVLRLAFGRGVGVRDRVDRSRALHDAVHLLQNGSTCEGR